MIYTVRTIVQRRL